MTTDKFKFALDSLVVIAFTSFAIFVLLSFESCEKKRIDSKSYSLCTKAYITCLETKKENCNFNFDNCHR